MVILKEQRIKKILKISKKSWRPRSMKAIIIWTLVLFVSLLTLRTNAEMTRELVRDKVLEIYEPAPFEGVLVDEDHYKELLKAVRDVRIYENSNEARLKQEIKCNECPDIELVFGGGVVLGFGIMLLVNLSK
jgi:hypothetical protein